jgi:hypothetical protein
LQINKQKQKQTIGGFIRFPVDDNFHMNSLSVHHMVLFELLLLLLNVHDEAFLEHHLILSNNSDHYLEEKYETLVFMNNSSYLLQYERIMLFFVEIMPRYVNCVHYVHLVFEEDHQQRVHNLYSVVHLLDRTTD